MLVKDLLRQPAESFMFQNLIKSKNAIIADNSKDGGVTKLGMLPNTFPKHFTRQNIVYFVCPLAFMLWINCIKNSQITNSLLLWNESVCYVSQMSSAPYDERPLPALKNRSSDQLVGQLEEMPPLTVSSTPRSPGVPGQPEALSENAQREASLPIEIYGDSLVRHSIGSYWLVDFCERRNEKQIWMPACDINQRMLWKEFEKSLDIC